jgi:hypothetical protein
MEFFVTPAFKELHLARGGSPFTILTSVEQAAVYKGFDEAILALTHHAGSNLNLYCTNANIDVLFDAIDYWLIALVCSLLFHSFLLTNLSPSYFSTFLMTFFDPTISGTAYFAASCWSTTFVTPT